MKQMKNLSLWSNGKDIEHVSKLLGRTGESCYARLANHGYERKEKVEVVLSEERAVVLKILCPKERVNDRFHKMIGRISMENGVCMDMSPYDDDNVYIIILISASEVIRQTSFFFFYFSI